MTEGERVGTCCQCGVLGKTRWLILWMVMGILSSMPGKISAQTQSFTFNASGTITIPAGVTLVTVQAWGGGAGGNTAANRGTPGGGGGAFAQATFTVIPNTTYAVNVGTGGLSDVNGGDSYFGDGTNVLAKGGSAPVYSNNAWTGGVGGQAAASVAVGTNTLKYSGGNGGAAAKNSGGGGGGAAYSYQNGSSGLAGSGTTGGAGGAGEGYGGKGGNKNQAGVDGLAPGGGGGGDGRGETGALGTSGAPGRVIVSWTLPEPSPSTSTISAASNTLVADGVSTTIITVHLKYPNGDYVTHGNNTVTLTTTLGTLSAVTDHQDGTYTATLTAPTTLGTAVITGTLDGVAITDTEEVAFTFGPPTQLLFENQPITTTAGTIFSPAVTVKIMDDFGRVITTATNTITLCLDHNPVFSPLLGTRIKDAINGVATFNDLYIEMAATGYTMSATATGLAGAISNPFDINPGTATRIIFTQSPTNSEPGAVIDPPVLVSFVDAYDNAVSVTNSVTLSIYDNPGGGTLSGTLTQNAVSGTASFTDLSIDLPGVGYTIKASATGFTDIVSDLFTIATGIATHLRFASQPTNTVVGTTISPAVTVRIEDSHGNLIPTATDQITLHIDQNPTGATLSGTLTVSAVNGIASFNDLSVNLVGVGYTLLATNGGLSPDVSDLFEIIPGAPAKLAYSVQPSHTQAGSAISPAISVQILDAGDNLVTTATETITLSWNNNPTGAILNGTLSVPAVAGVAVFDDISIDSTGLGYTLNAEAYGLIPAVSDSFNIVPGPLDPAKTFMTRSPGSIPANSMSYSVIRVLACDALGNNLTTGGAQVVLNTTAGVLGSVTDHGDGTYSAHLTSTLSVETATVTGTIDGISIPGSVQVNFVILADVTTYYPGGLSRDYLTLWLDADDPATLVPSSGTSVARWLDKSLDNNLASQAIITYQPTMAASTLNGRTAIYFSGDDYLVTPVYITGAQFGGGGTLFNLISWSQINATYRGVSGVGFDSPRYYLGPASNYSSYQIGVGDSYATSSIALSTNTTYLGEAAWNGSIATGYLNGTQAVSFAATLSGSNSYPFQLGRVNNQGYPLVGHFGEVIFYDKTFLISERNIIQNYHAAKWGNAIPAASTYYTAPAGFGNQLVGIGRYAANDLVLSTVFTAGMGFSSQSGTGGLLQTDATYVMAAHNNQTGLTQYLPAQVIGGNPTNRWSRAWYLQKTQPGADGDLTLYFDFSVVPDVGSPQGTDYSILYHPTDPTFPSATSQIINVSASTSGEKVSFTFSSAGLSNGYYTVVYGTDCSMYSATFSTRVTSGISPEYCNLTVASGGSVQLGQDVNVTNLFRVNDGGVLKCNNQIVTGLSFMLFPGGTLEITSPDGLSMTENTGQVQTTYRDFSIQANYVFNGSAAQITGTGFPDTVNILTVNNSAGVVASSDLTISGYLELTNGLFTVPSGYSLNVLAMSKASGTLRMLREYTGVKGWRMVTSPQQTTFGDLFDGADGFVTQGFAGSTFPAKQPNLLWFDETEIGTTNMAWRKPVALTDAMAPGRGYYYYIFNGAGITTGGTYSDVLPITMSATGLQHATVSGVFTYPITYNIKDIDNQPEVNRFLDLNSDDSGWNLIGNPTTATLNWDAESGWTKTNVDNTIYVFDPSSSDFLYWNGEAGTLNNGLITPFQAFWVKANAASPILSFDQAVKTTGGTFYKTLEKSGRYSDGSSLLIPLSLTSSDSLSSKIFLSFNESGIRGADRYDAYRLEPLSDSYLELFTLSSPRYVHPLVINNQPLSFDEDVRIPLYVGATNAGRDGSGNYRLDWQLPADWPSDLRVILMDNISKVAVAMDEKTSYSFRYQSTKSGSIPPDYPRLPDHIMRPTAQMSTLKADQVEPFTIVIKQGDPSEEPVYISPTAQLLPLYPNPVSDHGFIRFTLPQKSRVTIELFDLFGRRLAVITSAEYPAGLQMVDWNFASYPPGTYLIRLIDQHSTTAITVVKST